MTSSSLYQCPGCGTNYRGRHQLAVGAGGHFCSNCNYNVVPSESFSSNKRQQRNTQTLYHQTSPSNAKSIVANGFKPGKSNCMAGSGIYFAKSAKATNHKAHNHGAILECEVGVGRVRQISANGNKSFNWQRLQKNRYDSVGIPRSGGAEFVVRDPKQVRIKNVHYK